MVDVVDAVRNAVLARIKAGIVTASGLPVVGVYADPPQNMAMPAVTLDRVADEADDLLAEEQSRITVTLTIWSAARGPREAQAIRSGVRSLLHDADLTLTTGESVMCRYARGDVTRDADGRTYMGSVILNILAEY
jgi:hypothetical protein